MLRMQGFFLLSPFIALWMFIVLLMFTLLLPCITTQVLAAEPMVVKYINANPGVKEEYFLELIKRALQTTEASDGPYRVNYSEELLSAMANNEMLRAGEKLNVTRLTGFDRKDHPGKGSLKVNVPLLRGFLGYRIPLIRKESQVSFAAINALEDLRKIPLGLGRGWEGYIYKQNGFLLTESLNMTILLKMLVAGRFDFVPLGATEIADDYQVEGQAVDSLIPEKHLLLYMPMPIFFYVSAKNPALAQRLYAGLKKMEANGDMKNIFNNHFAARLKKLSLSRRTIITIPNPEDDGSQGAMNFSILNEY
jgi:hypothetical protein